MNKLCYIENNMGKKTATALEGADNFGASKVMIKTLLSTSVRIFLPTLGLFGIGAVIDFNTDTKPWGMVIGICAGIIVAAVLVFLQVKAIKKESSK